MALAKPGRIPVSTYRLQLHGEFTFEETRALVPYLDRLGITDIYSSPLLAARPGSTHCYDICDHTRLNPELGSETDFQDLSATLAEKRMGLVLDFVPNHMAVDESLNSYWRDVLENGPSSPWARFFDVDWDPVKPELKGKLLLPILGDQYGVALESGQLQIQFRAGEFSLQHLHHNLPLNPRQMRLLLRHDLDTLEAELGEDPNLREFLSILFQLDNIPVYTETAPALVSDRHREREIAHERLAALVEASPRIRQHVEANVAHFNGQPGGTASFDHLHELLEAQAYRLSYWRTAVHEINYRRFFDVNELAGIRMEDPAVFDAAHSLVVELVRQGVVTGLRLDHVDGLFDPAEYFRRLQAACCPNGPPVYVVVEKILTVGERLREDWAIHGTTGYEFLNDVNGLFVDSSNAQPFRRLYARFTGEQHLFEDVVYQSKRLIIMTSMASERNVLAHELNRISEASRRFRDFTLDSLQAALREVVACFPVYRTYFDGSQWSEFDETVINTAVTRAIRRNPAMEASIFEFIRTMMLPSRAECLDEADYQHRVQFAGKLQQYTGPVQAKGVEDTAFYRYGPLPSLNEVGGDPLRFGGAVDEFHTTNQERLHSWPFGMLTTSSHDTKRGEDARARLNVLSEIPDEWRKELSLWARANARLRTQVHGEPAPDRSDEYLFYQALIGAWPAQETTEPDRVFINRIRDYMWKAIKEEKIHTSWINPSEEYDSAVAQFVEQTLTAPRSVRFLRSFVPFQQRVARLGAVNSLSQLVLKIACPGVPDFYQGTELWDLNLVDPDNRRPLDFALRLRLLQDMGPILDKRDRNESVAAAVTEMLENWQDGRIKLFVTAAGLRLRRELAALFLEGGYSPLKAVGELQQHVVSFAREMDNHVVLAVVPRLVASLGRSGLALPIGNETWGETIIALPSELGDRHYRNVFTGEQILPEWGAEEPVLPVGDALRTCPVGLFVAE